MAYSSLAQQTNGQGLPSLRIANDYGTTNGYGSYWNNNDINIQNQQWMGDLGLSDIGNVDNNGISRLYDLQRYDSMNQNLNLQKQLFNQNSDYLNGWQHQYLEPASKIMGVASSLGNLFLGFKQYGLAKEQMGLAREKWSMTKDELNRIKGLRSKLTKQYMGA